MLASINFIVWENKDNKLFETTFNQRMCKNLVAERSQHINYYSRLPKCLIYADSACCMFNLIACYAHF
jgi:hypothetical protein